MRISRLIDILYLFASAFMLVLVLLVVWYSLGYWTDNYPLGRDIKSQMFYVGIGIAIVTALLQWIEGRIKAVIDGINDLTKREVRNGRRKRKNE